MQVGSVTEHKRYRNIKNNLQAVKHRVIYPEAKNALTASIVCYGPSLRDTWQAIDPLTTIVSVSKAHDFLIDREVTPHIHVEFDCRAHKAKHIQHANESTIYYLASCVHPDVVKRCRKFTTYLWHAMQVGGQDDATILAAEPDAKLIPGGSSVGLRAIELFYHLGYRNFEVHGMDSSFRDNGETQWAGIHHGRSREKREVLSLPFNGKYYKTSLAFASYADQFLGLRRRLGDAVINLHGDGLLQAMDAEDRKLMEEAA